MLLAGNDPIVPPELALPYLSEAPIGRVSVTVSPRGGHLHLPRGDRGGVVDELAARWRYLLGR